MDIAVIDGQEQAHRLYTVEEFARLAGVSPWSIRAHLTRGNLTPVHIGRLVRLTHAQLLEVQTRGLPRLSKPQAEEAEA